MSYSVVNSTILQKQAADSAAEVHGIAVALLCLDSSADANTWMDEVFAEDEGLLEDDKLMMITIFEQTKERMESEQFVFELFLPDDKEPLDVRCTAIVQWCQGFLFGLGRADKDTDWPDEVAEIIKDIVEFTKLDTEVDDDDEEAENAFVEIQEYLRAAVMLIRSEISDLSVGNNETVH